MSVLTATPEPALLNSKEVAQKLGLSQSHFCRERKKWKFLETARPIGQRRYSRALLERHLAGESPSQFGRRRV